MFLKKIRMVGFKSFADETLIQLESGITSIVGPNGCGKSNILDAVRWVLGEKSARGLRAKSMEDVIFLGSENRKPAGMAEVEMIFENRQRSLPLDMDEVAVGRRIYLNSSSSEYLLNGKKTTRREIEQIFMDTGIGKTAYSIMEQGRMSEILSASPDDRRLIFDEAAGVSRFKSEKEETQARLKDTDQNLLRLNDILKSKKEEMDHLETQAKKTKQYIHLKGHLDRHRLNLIYISYSELKLKKERINQKLDSILKRRDEIFDRISEHEVKAEEIETSLQSQIDEMHLMDRAYHQDQSRMQTIQENIDRLNKEAEDRKERLNGIDSRKKAEQKLNADIQAKMQASRQMELDLDGEIKTLQDASMRLGKVIQQLTLEIEQSQTKEQKNASEIILLDENQNKLLEELKDVTRDIILELESKKKALAQKEGYRKELKDTISDRLKSGSNALKNALEILEKEPSSVRKILADMPLGAIFDDFNKYEEIHEEFRSILFAPSGQLAKKEDLDHKMDDIHKRRDLLQKENSHLYEKRKLDMSSLEKERNRRVEMDLQIRDFQVRRESSVEARENITVQLKDSHDRLKYYEEELKIVREDVAKIEKQKSSFLGEMDLLKKTSLKQSGDLENIRKKIEKTKTEITSHREKSRKDRESIEKILPEIGELERSAENVSVQENALQEDLYNDFQISPGELEERCSSSSIRKQDEESEYRRIKGEISDLGQFNALAIEELERSRESYNQLKSQEDDINEARKNIFSMLQDIDEKSRSMFLETFTRIQNNFSEIFQTLFGGGNANLTLLNQEDPLSSGIDIMVQPPGKKNRSLSLLSGGEKNMTAIALMFATYLVRPAPFCFLDEIDAPLDDSNVGRFLKMLGGFTARSQFFVITHNKQTMMKSSAIFGVTQEEPGVSTLVSVRLGAENDKVSHA